MTNAAGLSYCSDCGEARVPHVLNKMELFFDDVTSPLFAPFERLDRYARGHMLVRGFDRAVLPICRTLSRMRLGTLSNQFDPRDSIRTKALFDGAAAAGVELWHFRPFNIGLDGIFIAQKEDAEIVFLTMPRPRLFVSPSLEWMDDKGKIKPYLRAHGIPFADGGTARTVRHAETIFARVGAPVITKPHRGTRGRHTTLGVHTRDDLRHAFTITKQISPQVVVERELRGIVHRVTLIGGMPVAIAKRDYPHVVGDGISTVAELMEKENTDPRRDDFSFYKIIRNERADAQLAAQNLTWDSVPARNQRVVLNDKVSRLHGTVTIDVTDEAHPDNVELFRHIGEAMGDPLIGMDFMIANIARSWKEQSGCGVIEFNAMPYIDIHHYMYEGTSRNVAKLLWEYVFAQERVS